MKSKSEILKMSKKELESYKWNDDLNIKETPKDTNKNCSYCFDCSYCSDCSDCLYCRNFKNHREGYFICNFKVTKKEFEKKKQEIEKCQN